jgi:hypothetical protein
VLVSLGEFSKVSTVVYLLNKITIKMTFQNFCLGECLQHGRVLGEVYHGDARQVKPAAHHYAPCVHLPQNSRGLAVGTTVVACLPAGNRGQQRARAKEAKQKKRKKGNRKRKRKGSKGHHASIAR